MTDSTSAGVKKLPGSCLSGPAALAVPMSRKVTSVTIAISNHDPVVKNFSIDGRFLGWFWLFARCWGGKSSGTTGHDANMNARQELLGHRPGNLATILAQDRLRAK